MARAKWIHGPLVDLAVIDFGWVPLYAAFVAVQLWWGSSWDCEAITRMSCPGDIQTLIALTIFVTRVHRHYGLPLAFGDGRMRARHWRLFVWTPIILAVLIFPAAMYRVIPNRWAAYAFYGVFTAASSVAGLWNLYHVIMQKYGFLRIYSTKLGWGEVKVEKQLFFSWMALLVAAVALRDADTYFDYLKGLGFGWAIRFEDPAVLAAKLLLLPIAAWAAWVSWRWLRVELANFRREAVPKLVFVASVALIYLTFAQSLLLGFLVFGFSHAFEYCIFTNLYATRAYGPRGEDEARARAGLLTLWARHPVVSNAVLVGAMVLLYKVIDVWAWLGVVSAYGFVSSLWHFAYDGVLWKMSQADVRKPVLDL